MSGDRAIRVPLVEVGADGVWLADGVAVRRGTVPAGAGAGRHAHGYHSVTVLLSSPGASTWSFGGERGWSGRPAAGGVFVCPAHTETCVWVGKPFECVSVCLTPAGLAGVADGVAGVAGVRPAVVRDDPLARHLVLALAGEAAGDRLGRGVMTASLTSALAVHLLREYAAPDRPPRRPGGLEADAFNRVLRHVDADLTGDLSLARLAAVAGLSRFHFVRLFRRSTGVTPHQYVVRRRVERAGALLRSGRPAAEVAAAVGFSSQSHLAHHVRRAFGRTPGELAAGAG